MLKNCALSLENKDYFHSTFQSASLLYSRLFYAKNLDTATAAANTFYALSNLFAFAAVSENQFLNIIGGKVKKEMDPLVLVRQQDPTIANLLYSKEVLDQYIQYISRVIYIIQSHWSSNWPKAIIAM
jgi:hypothetical protein